MTRRFALPLLTLALAACSSDDSTRTPAYPETQIPDAEHVAPLRPGLYMSAQGFANCGIEGVRYAFQDAEGTVVGEVMTSDAQGFIDLAAAPEGAKYVSYAYTPDPQLIRWDSSTFELAMFDGDEQSYRVEIANVEPQHVTPCSAIQGKSKVIYLQDQSEWADAEIQAVGDGVLDYNGGTLVLANDTEVQLLAYQNGQLVGSEQINSADYDDGDELPVTLADAPASLLVEDLMEQEWSEQYLGLRSSRAPMTQSILGQLQDGVVALLGQSDEEFSHSASFEYKQDDVLSLQRIDAQDNLLAAQPMAFGLATDVPFVSSSIDFPFMLSDTLCDSLGGLSYSDLVAFFDDLREKYPAIGIPELPNLPIDPEFIPNCELNQLAYRLGNEKDLETGRFAARYSATYFTGASTEDGLCSSTESDCRLINRNVYAMAEHEQKESQIWPPVIGYSRGNFFVPDLPVELTFQTIGGMIARQAFVVSDQQGPQFLHALANGEAGQLVDNSGDHETPIRKARLKRIGQADLPLEQDQFDARYRSSYQAVGKVN
ncbi:PX domain-containing protein [Ferrimonas marina]|uniref:Lipoprotein n=1 Tax=Ferrimonas marina TaxID=299255 RepID=A0A1M5RBA8_9GAMM|nr:hypothetical protein [Ferrimonas marina]SHH23585.1 hypothetical protein SAMN02745129_1556 [Ferrimonas marina]